jgi:hypothetical protein
MRHLKRNGFVICIALLGTGLLLPGANGIFPAAAAGSNPIVVENQQPGTDAWQIGLVATDAGGQIKGYASATSVTAGESLTFYASVKPVQTYTIDVYRIGWYQGLGGRLMQHVSPLVGVQQPGCPTDATTGMIACNWTPSYTLATQASWTSGIYLALLTNEQGYQNYITFVVRDDSRAAGLLYQQPVTTYQAYNNYPNDGQTGKSLYEYNSYGATTVTGTTRAAKVSFDRPYATNGSAHFFYWEINYVRWLEQSGYDVSYSTNLDTHANGERLLNHRGFLSVGHDEYWSKPMRDSVEAARDAGVNLAFFGANDMYWQVRFEPSAAGVPDRVMVGYKDAAIDPTSDPSLTTVNWRDPPLNRPEQTLMGVQYTAQLKNGGYVPWVVTNSTNWVYEGTGFANGDMVAGIVGYEGDRLFDTYPPPDAVTGTYTLLSHSPFHTEGNISDYHNSSVYQAPSGAWVFGAGTDGWAWALDNWGDHDLVDARIQQATANILGRFLTIPDPPDAYPHPQSASSINASLVPTFQPCSAANGVHGPPPLSGGPNPDQSCIPPQPTSSLARVGNQSVGSAQLAALPGDMAIDVSTNDVQTPLGAPYDPTPGSSAADLAAVIRFRITDRSSCSPSPCGAPYDSPGTTTDLDFSVPVNCEAGGVGAGSTCQASTTANAVIGAGAFSAGQQAVVQAFRVRLIDSANTIFEQQGHFVP